MTGLIGRTILRLAHAVNTAPTPEPVKVVVEVHVPSVDEHADQAILIAATGFDCADPECGICVDGGAAQEKLIDAVKAEIQRTRISR